MIGEDLDDGPLGIRLLGERWVDGQIAIDEQPKRVRLRRKAGWRKPPGVVVVARPGRFGNPYRAVACWRVECGRELPAKHWHVLFGEERLAYRVADQEQAVLGAVSLFARALEADLLPISVDEVRTELRGRDLACWCDLSQPCHADVLLQVANGPAVG